MEPRDHTSAWNLDDESTVAPVTWAGPPGAAPLPPWPAGFRLLDDFEIEAELGKGGMGIVHRVRQLSTGGRLAVKRTHLLHPDSRRLFLSELQTWLDLPEHPNLAPCRFFRVLGDEVVIFTDLAADGSLADAIRQRRFTRLADLLDISIQTARGLHTLHERGLVHKDVKPANVLLDGLAARVTDFGLARARARVVSADTGHSVLISTGGMTPAYCSPEQAEGRAVSRRTDVWSWGVLVLELFAGRSPCCDRGGCFALESLEQYLAARPGDIDAMPDDVMELLRLCFVADPAARWASLGEAADALADAYRATFSRDYPRPAPPIETPGLVERSAGWSGRYQSPRRWLALAFQAAGRDPTEADERLPPTAQTRRAQVVADLAAFDEAAELFRKLADGGQDLAPRLAALQVQRALAYAAAPDWAAAIEALDRAASLWQDLLYKQQRFALLPELVRTWLHAAHVRRRHGDYGGAIEQCDRVIRAWERLDNRRARRDLRDDLATACLEKGLALRSRGEPPAALGYFDRAIELWNQIVEVEGDEKPANELAQACLNKASVLSAQGRGEEALALCDQAITLRRRLVQRRGRRDLLGDLARAYVHKGNALRARNEVPAAITLYDQAIEVLERQRDDLDRDDLAPELARAYLARAGAERGRGDPARAAAWCAAASEVFERLVQREGRRELTGELARSYLQRGNSLRAAGDATGALTWCERAIDLWRRLVEDEGRGEWTGDLARGHIGKANALRATGQLADALTLYDRALELRQPLLTGGDADGAAGDVARDRLGRAEVLQEMGDTASAKQALERAASELELAFRRTPRSDLGAVLNKARRMLRDLA